MQGNSQKWIIVILRYLIALIFIYAAAGKIIHPAEFAKNIDNYRILPYLLVTIMAAVLPWLEFLCGLLFMFGRWLKGAALVVIIMNVIFIVAITSALARGLDITCGCFVLSGEGARLSYSRLLEDIFLLIATVMMYLTMVRAGKNT